jgi:phenylacetate-CoA ligase
MNDIDYNPIYDYSGPKDLAMFPILTRKDLKINEKHLFLKENTNTSKLYEDCTSGSTGIPLTIYRSWYERAFQIAKYLRVLFLNGYKMTDKILSMCSPERLKGNRTVIQKIGLLRRLAVNYLFPIPEIVDIILEYKPQVISANRSHIDLVALELLKRNKKPQKLKLILAGAEIINESNRILYKKAFGVNTAECYATIEMGVIAYEKIGETGLYLNNDLTYFEFLDKKGNASSPGDKSKIVVTDLLGKTMPFIRYDLGDYITFNRFKDSKGNNEIRITKIIGRDDEYIIMPDGSVSSGRVFHIALRKFPEVYQFKVIQKTKSYFNIMIAMNPEYFNYIKKQIINFLYEYFPKFCKFEIKRVDSIEPNSNGKLASIISEVKKEK